MAESKKFRVCGVEVPFILIGLLVVLFVTTSATIVAVTWKWRQDQAPVVNPNLTELPSVEVLYVSNIGDNTIRAFDLTGRDLGIFANTLSGAYALASDSTGNLYAAEVNNSVVEKFDTHGVPSVFASSGLHGPDGVIVDPSGRLFVASYSKNRILKFETNGTFSVMASTGLSGPARLALDTNGDLFVANFANSSIVKFEASGTSSVFASTGLSQPTCLAFDHSGQLYVANYDKNTIVKFDLDRTPSVFARSGLSAPTSMAFDRSGNLYVANSGNNTVVKFDTNGTPSTFASAGLKTPYGLAVGQRSLATTASSEPDAPATKAAPEVSRRAPDPLPDFQNASEVRVEFGAINRELGLHVVEVGDSKHALGRLDEEEAWFFQAGVNYCYLVIDPAFKTTLGSNAVVRVEFRVVRGNPLGLQYDNGKNRYAPARITSLERQQWDVVEFILSGASFRKAQNGGADFRLYDNEQGFFLKSVSVSRYERKPSSVRPPDLSARAPGAAPRLVEVSGSWYASLAEAEKQCRLILTNAQKMQAKGTYWETLLYDLAGVLSRQNKFAQAEPLYREILRSRQSRLKPEHDDVLAAITSLGRVLTEWAWVERGTNASAAHEHAREGEKLLQNALDGRLAKTSPVWTMAETQSRLGGALVVLAFTDPALTAATREPMLTQAEALLQQGHAGLARDMKAGPKFQRDALERFERLVRLYEAWEKPEKLAEWKQKLDDFDKGAGAGARTE